MKQSIILFRLLLVLFIYPFPLSAQNRPSLIADQMRITAVKLSQTELPIGQGEENQRLISINVAVKGRVKPMELTRLYCSLEGTTDLKDVSKVSIYFTGTSNRFSTTSLFAQKIPKSGTLSFRGHQTLQEGDNFFWVAVDVKKAAAEGHWVDATCEGIRASGQEWKLSPSEQFLPGNRTILLAHRLLFSSGDAGALHYRIPALVTAPDGSLLVAADKRNNGSGDLPADIDIVVRRSTDLGKTWSTAKVIADKGSYGASDPALVVDRNTGKIFCLFATKQGLFQSKPSDPISIELCTSSDNGITWTAPRDITSQIYGTTCANPMTQNWHAAWVASGKAFQLKNGRIAAAVGVRQTADRRIDNFMIYSDDGGEHWSVSAEPAELQGDEAKLMELENGKLLMSIRNPGVRRINLSSDFGNHWETAYDQKDLLDPNCNGDIIRYSSSKDPNGKNILLHSIPFAKNRTNVSVLLSNDEGKTWSVRKTIYAGASAYSSLTVLPDGSIGLFYENGEYETYQLYFTRFTLAWLTDEKKL